MTAIGTKLPSEPNRSMSDIGGEAVVKYAELHGRFRPEAVVREASLGHQRGKEYRTLGRQPR